MPEHKYSDELVNEAARLRECGMSCEAIARRLCMSRSAVEWHCLKLGADTPKAKVPEKWTGPTVMKRGNHTIRRFTEEEDQTILKMDIAGERVCDIARAIDRPPNSVRGRMMTLARHQERRQRSR